MDKDKTKVVTFKCRFKRFSTYLKSGKRIRFSDGIYRTSDADVIDHLRKNYRPPMMAEVEEYEKVAVVNGKDVPQFSEGAKADAKPSVPPFFPGQSEALAHLAAPPAADAIPEKKSGSKK